MSFWPATLQPTTVDKVHRGTGKTGKCRSRSCPENCIIRSLMLHYHLLLFSFLYDFRSLSGKLSSFIHALCLFPPQDGIPHAHAFLYSSEGVRFCEVERTSSSKRTLSFLRQYPCFYFLLKTAVSGYSCSSTCIKKRKGFLCLLVA